MDSKMWIKFWGTRGLISSPRAETAKYGGNTTAIQLIYKEHLVIVDTGFGVSNLGEELMNQILAEKKKLHIHIFFTHFHWDHVQGLPFFHPIYFPSSTLDIYTPATKPMAHQLLDILFDGSYSPFAGIDSMPSNVRLHQVEGDFKIGDLSVDIQPLDHLCDVNHPLETVAHAYKFTSPEGEEVVIATDHEAKEGIVNANLVDFAKDTGLLIHDGQFTDKEYESKSGWGHSTMSAALKNGLSANAKQTLLTHHAPWRDDREMDYEGQNLQKLGCNFDFACELKEFQVPKRSSKLKKVG